MAKLPNRDERLASAREKKRPNQEPGTTPQHQREDPKQDEKRMPHHSGAAELRPIKRRRRKRLRLGEAFRKAGLDEQTVAETYVRVVDRLRRKIAQDTVQKLLVDVLKECSRVLDPPRGTNAGAEQPTVVELHHDIPRPALDEFAEPDESPGV